MMPLVRSAPARWTRVMRLSSIVLRKRAKPPRRTPSAAALPGLMGVEISARDRALIFLERACNVVTYTAQRIGRGPDFSHHLVSSLSAPRHSFGDRRTQL